MRKDVGCSASLALLCIWVPSCSTHQHPFERFGYSLTLVSKVVRCVWPPSPDVLAVSCSAPGIQFSVALYLLFLKEMEMSVFCALCVVSGRLLTAG